MHVDRADLANVPKANVRPCFSRINRLVNALADRDIAADRIGAGAGVDHVRIRIRNIDGAHRCGFEKTIRYVVPRCARVRCLPDAAAG